METKNITSTSTALLNWGQGTTELELFLRRMLVILKDFEKSESQTLKVRNIESILLTELIL